MSKKILTLCLCLWVGWLSVNCSNTPPKKEYRFQQITLYNDSVSPLAQQLLSFADELQHRLNGTLIIARHDTILVERAYGYLQLFNETTGYPTLAFSQLKTLKAQPSNTMTLESVFDLASLSKQFTAAAILKLCADHKLNLSDSLYRFYPKLPYKNVTIQQLLTHTSGIPEYFNFAFSYYDTSLFIDNTQLIKVMEQQRFPSMFTRGARFKYVNTKYALLADIVVQVTNMSFEEFVRTYLWKPAGMKDALFFTEIVGLHPNKVLKPIPIQQGDEYIPVFPLQDTAFPPIARGHWRSGALASYDRLNGILGDKGIYCSAKDLIQWTNAFYIQYKVLPKKWVELMTTCQNQLSNGTFPEEQYGYGVRMENKDGHGKTIYHGGLWDGFHNVWLYRPSDGLQIVFLSNYYNRAHIGKCDEILNIVDGVPQ